MSVRNSKIHKKARRIARKIRSKNARTRVPFIEKVIWVKIKDKYGREDYIKQTIPTRRIL